MKDYINEGIFDRFARVLAAELAFLGAFFWIGGTLQIVLFVISVVLLFTGVTGFCAMYRLVGVNTYKKDTKISKVVLSIFVIVVLLIGTLGAYYSNFFTKKFFLEDYNQMNNYYKQTLFFTGQGKRDESVQNYSMLVPEYSIFLTKYTNYHPYALRSDAGLNDDLMNMSTMIANLKETVYTGNLNEAHLALEKIRPIFQDILKRNNFSLLAVSLVDFHDVMEKVLDAADAKDARAVLAAYKEADEKLKAVEVEVNDAEIQSIRANLEAVKTLAEQGSMDTIAAKAGELKSSFVKVYLKRG